MKLSAFTLLEILVVMAIIGMLIAVGIGGLLRLRASMEAEQATNQILSILESAQNKAKNNVVEESKLPLTQKANQFDYVFGVRFNFNGTTMTKSICWRNTGGAWAVGAGTCTSSSNVTITGVTKFSTVTAPACTDLLFENLSEKIIILSPATGNCKIGIETSTFTPIPYKYLNFYRAGYYDATAP